MASAFGHFASAWAISNLIKLKEPISKWAIFVGMICAALPDIDIIGFKLGVPYESMWGHRGITHSLFAALLLSFALCFFMAKTKKTRFILFIYFFLCTASHGILDAMTTGGKGIAFFAPFDNTRYFLPWRVIQVSPIGIKNFMGEWGVKVLTSELLWIGIPTLLTFIIYHFYKKTKKPKTMRSFNPKDLQLKQRHQYIIGAVGPRPICWASTIDKKGNPNLAPYSFFGAFGANPSILVFSSNRRGRDNTTKDTLHNIEATKEVVINIVSHDLVNQMNISSTDYPSDINEFEKAGVTPLASDEIKPFRVAESKVQFECKVNDIVYTGQEGGAANLFICEIVKMHLNESILDDDDQINPYALDLVGRIGKNYYVRANEKSIFEINNPFEKENIGFDTLPDHIKESKILTGNQLAQMAMLSNIPSKEDINLFKIKNENYAKLSIDQKHQTAGLWISKGKIEAALKLLMTI